MKTTCAPLFKLMLLLACAALLAGCQKDPNLEFIQGAWHYKDIHLSNIPGESHLNDNWQFDNYTFSESMCCFTHGDVAGSYRIVESDEDRLTLELFNLEGQMQGIVYSAGDTLELLIVIDRENDTLEINHTGPYTRVTP